MGRYSSVGCRSTTSSRARGRTARADMPKGHRPREASGISRVGFETDEPQRNRGAGFPPRPAARTARRGAPTDPARSIPRCRRRAGLRVWSTAARHPLPGSSAAPIRHPPTRDGPRPARAVRGELPVAVPMLVIRRGQSQAERHLERESGGQPARPQARRQQRHGRGHGQQIARRAGEENHQRAARRKWRSTPAGTASPARGVCARPAGTRPAPGRGKHEPAVNRAAPRRSAALLQSAWKP